MSSPLPPEMSQCASQARTSWTLSLFLQERYGQKKTTKKAICLVNKTPLNLRHAHRLTHTSSRRQEAGQEAPICAPVVLSSRRLAAESGVPIVEPFPSLISPTCLMVIHCIILHSDLLYPLRVFSLKERRLPEPVVSDATPGYRRVIYCRTQ